MPWPWAWTGRSSATVANHARTQRAQHKPWLLPAVAVSMQVPGSSRCDARETEEQEQEKEKRDIEDVRGSTRLDTHGGAADRALATIGPYGVARARTPAALNGSMAGLGGIIPRHGHLGQMGSSNCDAASAHTHTQHNTHSWARCAHTAPVGGEREGVGVDRGLLAQKAPRTAASWRRDAKPSESVCVCAWDVRSGKQGESGETRAIAGGDGRAVGATSRGMGRGGGGNRNSNSKW